MIKKISFGLTLLLILAITACGSKKEQPTQVVSYNGTYETVIPAADGPGIYIRLAISGEGYSLYEKYLTEEGAFVSYGKLKDLTDKGFVIGDNMKIDIKEDGALTCQDKDFTKISEDTVLAKPLVTTVYKDDKTGNDLEVEVYTQDGKQYAKVEYEGTKYELMADGEADVKDATVFANDKVSLKLATKGQSSLTVGKESTPVTLTQLGPNYATYVTEEKEAEPLFDVVYVNDEENSFVLLLSADSKQCYQLERKEASAKTAVYGDEKVEWATKVDKSATLTVNGKTVKYSLKK